MWENDIVGMSSYLKQFVWYGCGLPMLVGGLGVVLDIERVGRGTLLR